MKCHRIAITLPAALVICGYFSAAEASSDSEARGKITVFLADPELGVVGAYSEGGNTIYFETRAADAQSGGTELNVRLLDAGGRTIAVSGDHVDASRWLSDRLEPAAAAASQKLALPLADELGRALVDPAFDAERAALSELASSAAGADLSHEVMRAPPSKAAPALSTESAREEFYSRASEELRRHQNGRVEVDADFRGTRLEAMDLSFPTELNEQGGLGRTETYARLVSSDGQTLFAEFGGDFYPDGWEPIPAGSTAEDDVVTHLSKLGEATMAAHLLVKSTPQEVSMMSAGQLAAFERMAVSLREDLLPHTDEGKVAPDGEGQLSPMAGGTWSPKYNKSTNFREWTHPVAQPIGEHSGTQVEGYLWPSPSTYTLSHRQSFGNHGELPGARGMKFRCQFSGNFHSGYSYAPEQNTTPGRPSDHSWHSCNTPYSAPSFGGHNCNDDAKTQLFWTNLRGSEASTKGNWCDDPWMHNNGPHCDEAGAPR